MLSKLEVVLPEPGTPGQQLVGLRTDQPDAVAVLAGDLAAGVDDEQLAVVVRQHQRLNRQRPFHTDAAGDVVLETGDNGTGRRVDRGQAGSGDVVDRGELAPDVHGGV
jgi:hypothetical protein